MTLEESVLNLEKLESNGLLAYIDSNIYKWIVQRGNIYVDYLDDLRTSQGLVISVKRTPDEKPCCG